MGSGRLTILHGEGAGTSTAILADGAYTIPGLSPGSITFAVSVPGYRDAQGTAVVTDDNVTLNFTVPRIARSPQPSLAGAWRGLLTTRSSVMVAEFTFVQSGGSVRGTWQIPVLRWAGNINGRIDGERSLTGQLTVDSGCSSVTDIDYGLLDYEEERLTLATRFTGSCGPGHDYSFQLSRQPAR